MKRYIVELYEGLDIVDKMEVVAESWLAARKQALLEAASDVRRPKWPLDPLHRDIRSTAVAKGKKRG